MSIQAILTGQKSGGGGSQARVVPLTLSSSWTGNTSPYTQSVTIAGITSYSKVDLEPNNATLTQMAADKTTAIYIENNNGVLTAYAVNAAPTAAITVQATIMEVES